MSNEPTLRVAVIGAGPAGLYTTAHLIEQRDLAIEVDLIDALPTPWGLIRSGVAPDHPEKKLIVDRLFDFILRHPRVRFVGNVKVGQDISVAELARLYTASFYCIGAAGDNALGIAGEALQGVWSARQFVSFYNGHPDFCSLPFDLSCQRAVVIGNGNVALDIARALTRDISVLRRTDMADNALELLGRSMVEEVVIVARRGPVDASYNSPELEEFFHIPEVDVSVRGIDPVELEGRNTGSAAARKNAILRALAARPSRRGNRRLIFQFHRTPVAIEGRVRAESITLATSGIESGSLERLSAGLVLRSVGYKGTAVPGLPYDDARGVIANSRGRVEDLEGVVPGVYVAGWIKRGCRGVIGSNKKCARQTVDTMLDDFARGQLQTQSAGRDVTWNVIAACAPQAILLPQWLRIDHAERASGHLQDRPRVKIVERGKLLATGASGVLKVPS